MTSRSPNGTDTSATRVRPASADASSTAPSIRYLGGELVADPTEPLLVWEKPSYPSYYCPAVDVRTELLS
jgi:uncharacterized protein (DUF427 family)